MRSIRLTGKLAVAALLIGTTGFAGAAAATATAGVIRVHDACATVTVTAKPKLNTQAGSDETIQNEIMSCSAHTEAVQIKQKLSLPGAFSGTFTLPPHGHVEITQHIPYVCCGSYDVIDHVFSTSGTLLHTAKATWTDA